METDRRSVQLTADRTDRALYRRTGHVAALAGVHGGALHLRYPASGPLLRAALERAADGKLVDGDDELLLFRALHIVGVRRDPLGFDLLLRILHRPNDELEDLLGDAITETLPRIAIGVFNGDTEALFDAIVDLRLDEYVRSALLGAATFLTWEGRIERAQMVGFLGRFYAEKTTPGREKWPGPPGRLQSLCWGFVSCNRP